MNLACRASVVVSISLAALGLVACSGTDGNGSSSSSSGSVDAGSADAGQQQTCTPAAVSCEDEMILGMNLKATVAPGLINNTQDGTGWRTHVDATAGGAFTTNPHAFVYGAFEDTGLQKKELSDEDALTSTDWDVAFRRYVIRVNSGSSGPGCVNAARMSGGTTFDGLTAVPDNAIWREDIFYDASCTFISDGSGLESSPATALSSFYSYPGCVQMTGNIFVVRRADGRHLKVEVTHYYNEAAQAECQASDATTTSPTGSGNIRFRWAFLD